MTPARKLCLLGDFSVGKTSLVRRYMHDAFSLDYQATVGVHVHEHADQIETDQGAVPLSLTLWDIEGSRHGEDLVTTYILGSSGALVVGDVTRPDVLTSMRKHADRFLEVLPGRPILFAMNKCDLLAKDAWPDGEELVKTYGYELLHTSALTGFSVRPAVHSLARRILELGA